MARGEGFGIQGLVPRRSSGWAGIVGGPRGLLVMMLLLLHRLRLVVVLMVVFLLLGIDVITRTRICGIVEVGAGEGTLNGGTQALQKGR